MKKRNLFYYLFILGVSSFPYRTSVSFSTSRQGDVLRTTSPPWVLWTLGQTWGLTFVSCWSTPELKGWTWFDSRLIYRDFQGTLGGRCRGRNIHVLTVRVTDFFGPHVLLGRWVLSLTVPTFLVPDKDNSQDCLVMSLSKSLYVCWVSVIHR